MPRFEVTSPSGQRFEITAPEGATQDQVLAYARQQFGAQQPTQQPPPPQPQEGDLQTFVKGTGRGALGVGESILNAPEALYNLGKAGVGTAMGAAGVPGRYLPDVTQPQDFLGSTVGRLIRQNLDLENHGNKFLSTLGELTGAGLVGGIGGFERGTAGELAKKVLTTAVAPAAGGATGEMIGGKPGGLLGTLVAGMAPAAPAAIRQMVVRNNAEKIAHNIADVKAAGVQDITPGQAVHEVPGRGWVQGPENAVGSSPGGVGQMNEVAMRQVRDLQNKKNAAIEAIGGTREADVAGQRLLEGIKPYKVEQGRIYEQLNDRIGQHFKNGQEAIPLTNYKQALDEL